MRHILEEGRKTGRTRRRQGMTGQFSLYRQDRTGRRRRKTRKRQWQACLSVAVFMFLHGMRHGMALGTRQASVTSMVFFTWATLPFTPTPYHAHFPACYLCCLALLPALFSLPLARWAPYTLWWRGLLFSVGCVLLVPPPPPPLVLVCSRPIAGPGLLPILVSNHACPYPPSQCCGWAPPLTFLVPWWRVWGQAGRPCLTQF